MSFGRGAWGRCGVREAGGADEFDRLDGGCYRSLDGIYKKHGAVQIEIVGKIAEAVLRGLTYLYDEHRIMHRGGSQVYNGWVSPSPVTDRSLDEITMCPQCYQISNHPTSSSTPRETSRFAISAFRAS